MQTRMNVSFTGDTPLHLAVRNSTSFYEFNNAISSLSLDEQTQYALTTNDNGQLPLDVINNTMSHDDKDQVFSCLLNLALREKNKTLSETVDFQALVNEYHLIPGTKRYNNFKYACEIVNETRKHCLGKISVTHPDTNGKEADKVATLMDELCSIRWHEDKRFLQILFMQGIFRENPTKTNQIIVSFTKSTQQELLTCQQNIENCHVNNCGEIASFAFRLGLNRHLNIVPYAYQNNKGDHIFDLILDNSETGVTIDACHVDDVICDAWAGLVCLASEYKYKVRDFRYFEHKGKIYNLLPRFNPNYNCLNESFIFGYYNEITYTMTFSYNFVDKFIEPLLKDLTPRDKFLFGEIIRSNLYKAVYNKLISKHQILSWSDPVYMLKKYFANDDLYLPLLTYLYAPNEALFKAKFWKALSISSIAEIIISGQYTLRTAAYHGYDDVVDALLKAGVNPNAGNVVNGSTALFVAAQNGKSSVVDLLLNHPAIAIKPLHQSALCYRDFVKSCSTDIQARMENYIQARLKQGHKKSAIYISPIEMAEVMGHNDIASKIRKAEKAKNPLALSTCFGLFKPGINPNLLTRLAFNQSAPFVPGSRLS